MENEKISWPGWETVRLIGQGSFGTVYEIQRQVFDDTEKAALKVISIPQNKSDIEEMYSDGYDDESITSTFQSHLKSIVAEYSLTRKMNDCVNIVSCDDVRYVQHDDGIGWDIFIKMELLTPLTKALPASIEEGMVLKLAIDMCNALHMCKSHGVVHRDIKPQNIFVSAAGDYKLGDFGIAKTVEKTMGGTKIGTYKYMAPEVYNSQPYGHSADIYSLGMVLYWLLNERRLPFLPLPPEKLKAGMEESARRRRMAGEALPAPAHGSDALKQIVLKACAFDQYQRYQSPDQMRQELLAAQQEWRVRHPELSGMQICPACGGVLEADCRFCVLCGSPITVEWQDGEETQAQLAEEEEFTEVLTASEPTAQEPTEEEPAGEIVILDKWVRVPQETVQPPVTEQGKPPQCGCCGAAIVPGTRFCTCCGVSLEQQPEPESPAQEVQASEPEEAPELAQTADRTACPYCGAELIPGNKFCIRCGVSLEQQPEPESPAQEVQASEPEEAPQIDQAADRPACPYCGADLLPGNKFCICCGAVLHSPASPQRPAKPVCGHCGAELTQDIKFCTRCGAPRDT